MCLYKFEGAFSDILSTDIPGVVECMDGSEGYAAVLVCDDDGSAVGDGLAAGDGSEYGGGSECFDSWAADDSWAAGGCFVDGGGVLADGGGGGKHSADGGGSVLADGVLADGDGKRLAGKRSAEGGGSADDDGKDDSEPEPKKRRLTNHEKLAKVKAHWAAKRGAN